MDHRHLLPNEIDLLLDGDAGFAVPIPRVTSALASQISQIAQSVYGYDTHGNFSHWLDISNDETHPIQAGQSYAPMPAPFANQLQGK